MLEMHPGWFFLLVLGVFAAATLLGARLRRHNREPIEPEMASLKTLEGALLALLGLLLGFTFSMAVSRYDERRTLQIAEANNLGTLWLRTSLLHEPARSDERVLLQRYVPVRLAFLNAGTSRRAIEASLDETGRLQEAMWRAMQAETDASRDPVTALFVSALNDSIDAAERRTAAFENHIPATAWGMLLFIGAVASAVVGMGLHPQAGWLRWVLPFVLASALALTYDLDSPRAGLIQLQQTSMERLQQQVEAVRAK